MMPGLTDASELAHALEPALRDACDGRLGPVRWFRTDWQRGGAATGFSTFRYDGEETPRDVVVKLPIGPTEHRTLVELGKTDAPTPRVAADGGTGLVRRRLGGDGETPGLPLSTRCPACRRRPRHEA